MIMGGRGRRITGGGETAEIGGPESTHGLPSTLPSLLSSINEINLTGMSAPLLARLKSAMKEIFTTKDSMRNGLSEMHEKALLDPEFGEKLVLALEQASDLEVESVLLRNELLSFIQNDFKVKETVFQTDRKKFINSVLLLGHVYRRIKVCGEPIVILGVALLEYFDLLIKGDEEEFKTITKEIFINGANLSQVNKYELLVHDLRKIIVNENLNPKCKCWILLAIDFISNEYKPLKGMVRNFYVANLGEEFKKLESVSQLSPKGKESISEKKNKTESSPSSKTGNFKKDLSKHFSEINIRSDKGNKEKVQSPPGKNSKKDNWKPSGGMKKGFGHDDRFEREENFYGVQKPRQPKPETFRRNFNDAKPSDTKEFEFSKTDFGNNTDTQFCSGGEDWN